MSAPRMFTSPVHSRTVLVAHQQGLHMRPCSVIVDTVGRHQANVTVQRGSQSANAASMLGLLSLAAAEGTELILSATGPEAEEVLETLARLFVGAPELTDAK